MTLDLDPGLLEAQLRELALEARAHRFEVAPNPCVGAGILSGGRLVARGFHEHWGGAHAELQALREADRLGIPLAERDALLVTLEPCSSFGKTPPCTEAVIEAGLRRVVVGATDPDPRHRGQGLERLRGAGVEVVELPTGSPLEQTSPHFLRWTSPARTRSRRPWVVAKWAQTMTGQLVPPPEVGEGRWISGPEALEEVQVLRSRVDAILTGSGTVLADDPRLTVRGPAAAGLTEGPGRVVLDTDLRTPPEAKLLRAPGPDERGGPLLFFARTDIDPVRARRLVEASEAPGIEVTTARMADRTHFDLRDVLERLWERGVRRLMVEAGPSLLQALFDAGLVDQVRIYTGSVRGGEGPTLGPWLAQARLEQRMDSEVGTMARLDAFVS
ncbi:MAG: bifunctional diaminohydroxyphosphoribosylaminopyrimidine deaminase/5-amino-6-(5-phosphoribosylamino)uracil reductase RibD [Planctomycetes bacterium]|nr:bifunctional diaminohydroxyphosphoribosylaminopyrimidine deaminase/5-amino-6-(5-phosphoribosylamino)uracil reductase RibD [Planctomycetota bacterium]